MKFGLRCWVPSLKQFVCIEELKMEQLSILSKYILNEDYIGTNKCFNEIILENLEDKNIFSSLTIFDKWFILTFLRAVNISSIVYIQTTTTQQAKCNVEVDLFNLLTEFSELNLPVSLSTEIESVKFELKMPSELYSENVVLDTLKSVSVDDHKVEINPENFNTLFKASPLYLQFLNNFLTAQDLQFKNYFLLKQEGSINLQNVPLRLYDKTLFFFIRSIYLPFCKSIFNKKFKLLKHVGLSLNDINKLTFAECEIFINQYIAEENEKKSKQNTSGR